MSPAQPRTVVIGLDGATWDLLDRFIAEGVMPNLGRLATEGARGPLRTVIPPMTATAWTSYQTGKGPGKHGVYDWTEPVPNTYLFRPIDSTHVQSRTLFELLSERGRRVATVNLPLTFPARAINGVAVGDMLTPNKESPGFTYPPEFKATLDRVSPDYVIDTYLCESEADILPFLARLKAMIEGRGRVIRHLMEQEPWDLFCTVWVEMDRMQHCLWHIFDPEHPSHDRGLAAKYRPAILEVYRLIDHWIGEMARLRPPDANLVFLSDHGFGYCRYKVFLNTWLAQEGFLTFASQEHASRGRLNQVRGALDRVGLDTRRILALARKLGGDALLKAGSAKFSRFASDIDWSRTQAYCHGTNSIRINLAGREPNGAVSLADYAAVCARLRERLLALRDPEGNRIIHEVSLRSELYHGPAVDLAADVLIAGHDDSVWFYYSEGDVPERIFEPSQWASGNHKPDGLFLAWGPDIRAGAVEGAHINDVLPTIFALMGVPIPDDVDGQVLHTVSARRLRPLYTEAKRYHSHVRSRSDAENAAIEERLSRLGYLQ